MKLRLDPEDVELIAAAVVDKLRAGTVPGWIDQGASSLGRRRHIAAVRRRVQAGEGGAVQLGRRYLLGKEAHDAELNGLGAGASTDETEEQIARELGLRLVGGTKD
jgi:hypothetical protein